MPASTSVTGLSRIGVFDTPFLRPPRLRQPYRRLLLRHDLPEPTFGRERACEMVDAMLAWTIARYGTWFWTGLQCDRILNRY
jgi:hypothetical protein